MRNYFFPNTQEDTWLCFTHKKKKNKKNKSIALSIYFAQLRHRQQNTDLYDLS